MAEIVKDHFCKLLTKRIEQAPWIHNRLDTHLGLRVGKASGCWVSWSSGEQW